MAGREPTSSPLALPPAYGKATRPMAWSEADRLLTESRVYWLASVRTDGRPHVVPSDGIWLGAALYFGGSPETVHMRNVRATGHAVAHVGDGLAAAVIVEGTVTDETPTQDVAERLAEANNTKYADYGMTMEPSDYVKTGVTALRPRRVLAWTRYPENATRFEFD
jgi:nitroimidazol reductase NimA-like FMN-containing flavoprotein (pyridoxamine 5'-phosphate oxidase superfamily)